MEKSKYSPGQPVWYYGPDFEHGVYWYIEPRYVINDLMTHRVHNKVFKVFSYVNFDVKDNEIRELSSNEMILYGKEVIDG